MVEVTADWRSIVNEGEKNKKRFDEISEDWDKKPRRVILAEKVFKAILSSGVLQGSESAMEFGCGTGLLTVQMADKLKQITAYDVSSKMLRQLEEKIVTSGYSHIKVFEKDISQQPDSGTYDLIFSSMTLHHIDRVDQLMDYLFQCLNPGGKIALADLEKEDGFFHDRVDGVVHHGFDRDYLKAVLLGAGFKEIRFFEAHTIQKEDDAGNLKPYGVFLLTAKK